jgi:GNAT superfamily N-acetyltransferase
MNTDDTDRTESATGPFGRLLKAIGRRLPRTRTLLVFTGPPDITYEGTLAAKGFGMDEITAENIERAAEFRKRDVVVQMKNYLDKGYRGWFATLGDEIAGYAFLAAIKDKPTIVRRLMLHPGEAGSILVYTRPEYRIFGIGPALTREISARAAAMEGIDTLVVWTAPVHKRWLESLRAYDMEPAGRVWILELFGRPIIRRTIGSKVKR